MPLMQLAASAHSQNQTGGNMGEECRGDDGGRIKRSRSGVGATRRPVRRTRAGEPDCPEVRSHMHKSFEAWHSW